MLRVFHIWQPCAWRKAKTLAFLARVVFLAAAIACGTSTLAFAGDAPEAAATVGHLSRSLVELVSLPADATAQKRAGFVLVLHSDFDLPTIGRFVAGASWAAATPQQRDAFLGLFENRLVDAYAGQIETYGVNRMTITETLPVEGSADLLVTTQIDRANALPSFLSWRLRKFATGYRIIDLVISGVSLAVTERDTLAAAARDGGMAALIGALQGAGALPR